MDDVMALILWALSLLIYSMAILNVPELGNFFKQQFAQFEEEEKFRAKVGKAFGIKIRSWLYEKK